MITHKEAVRRLLNVSPHARKAIERMLLWNESKTMKENALRLNVNMPMAMRLAGEYSLKFKHLRAEWESKHPKVMAYLDLRKAGWSLREIADIFKVTHQAVSSSLKTRANDPLEDRRGRPRKKLKA